MLSQRLAQIEDEVTAERFGLPAPISGGIIMLSEFIETYKKRKAGKTSLDRDIQRLNYIVKLMGDRPLAAFGKDNFQALEKKLLELKRKPATVNRYFAVLHHLFDIAIKERILAQNPLADFEYFIEDEQHGRALSDNELKALFSALREIRDAAGTREHVKRILHDLALFGVLTGARLSEIIFLRHDQVDGDIIRLRITQTKFRKRGRRSNVKEKLIFLSPAALGIIRRQPRSPDGFVFSLLRRDARVISKAVHTLRPKLGVPGFSFHSLRHTFVTRATELADTATVRVLVGHSDYRTTLKYVHPDMLKRRKVVAKMGTKFSSFDVND